MFSMQWLVEFLEVLTGLSSPIRVRMYLEEWPQDLLSSVAEPVLSVLLVKQTWKEKSKLRDVLMKVLCWSTQTSTIKISDTGSD